MANTVYTESVVSLNAASAEATLNALKNQADELSAKMREATKLGNTKDAEEYRRQLDNTRKAMTGITRETKDYSDLMKRLNGSTLNELSKAYSNLNRQIKNLVPGTKEFVEKSRQLKEVKARMDEVNGSVRGTNRTLDALKGMLPKLGLAAVFAAAAKAVVKFAKDAVSQTQLVGDRWAQFSHGMSNAYNTFVADLTSGKGWKELIRNMRESYRVGKEVEAMLDELFERNNSLTLKESEYNVEIERNKQIMRDRTKSDQERLNAAETAMSKERELADERKQIAAQEADARKKDLQDRTKMTDADLELYVTEYNRNRNVIQQAQAYNAELRKREAAVKSAKTATMFAQDGVSAAAAGQRYSEAQKALDSYIANADEGVKRVAAIDAAYQLSNDELVSNYVQATAKMNNADAEYFRSTARVASTASSLKKELSEEALAASENAFKEEIAGVDRHQKEMEVLAKEAYASGEISEQQYQSRLIAIQETALKSKAAIADRYRKDTVEYQAQLLDLTIKQQEELRKIFEDSERDAAKVLEDMMKAEDEELKSLMAEIDADLENQLNRLIDLAEKADMVKAMMNPQETLGQMFLSEMDSLQEMYDSKLLSEEEFQEAKRKLVERYAKDNLALELEPWMKGVAQAQEYINQAGNAVSALQDAEMARLDARMQAELTAAGDNAEERQRIEEEYEKKKLDTQKKYAVADMVVNIAKTVAAGALAVMQCFAQLGPIAGGAMAAIIAVTTAAQVASIVAQKDAIMNASPGSSGTSSQSGARVATGYSSGGYTSKAANDYQEVGVVHANEWVAPAAMVRSNPVMFRRLEQARRRGGTVSGVSGFADGGMTTAQDVRLIAMAI